VGLVVGALGALSLAPAVVGHEGPPGLSWGSAPSGSGLMSEAASEVFDGFTYSRF